MNEEKRQLSDFEKGFDDAINGRFKPPTHYNIRNFNYLSGHHAASKVMENGLCITYGLIKAEKKELIT